MVVNNLIVISLQYLKKIRSFPKKQCCIILVLQKLKYNKKTRMPKRKCFQIGDENFSTQKKLEERCKGIKHNNLNSNICEVKDVSFLTNLLSRHPKSLQKLGVGLKEFSVRKNGNDFCFWITRIDDTSEDFSYISCISPPSIQTIQNEAFRNEIRPQIQEFRDLSGDSSVCPVCRLIKTVFHVDHDCPLFHDLVTKFNSTQTHCNLETMKNKQDQIIFIDRNFAQLWIEYHQNFASLRIICSDCNLSRPKKTMKVQSKKQLK